MQEQKISKFQIVVTVVGFLGLLFIPSIAWVFCHDLIGDDMSENRKLAEVPEFKLGKISVFPKKFENFYNDHVPFRAVIRGAWSNLNVIGMHDSVSSKVTIGKSKEGFSKSWMFYSPDGYSNTVLDAQGLMEFGDEKMSKMKMVMKDNAANMDERGIELYYFVPPNKSSIYKEMLPDNVEIYNDTRRIKRFEDYLGRTSNYKFAEDDLLEAKNIEPLYYSSDTHWNKLGAFVGFKSLMKMIEPEYKNFDYKISKNETRKGGDLAGMLGLGDYFLDVNIDIQYLNSLTYKETVEQMDASALVETTNNKAPIKKTIMVVGDSFRENMKDYLAKTFSHCVLVHREDYKEEMIAEYKPNTIVLEFVEKMINHIDEVKL